MQGERAELGRDTPFDRGHRIRDPAAGHDDVKAREVLAKYLERRVLYPRVAESDTGGQATPELRARSIVDGALEDRDPGLVPQAPAEQDGRVGGCGEQRRGHQLCQVVEALELVGSDLNVQLQARVGRLDHDAVVNDVEQVDAIDAYGKRATPETCEGRVHLTVARLRSEIVDREILVA